MDTKKEILTPLVETNYPEHKQNPGPSPEAVNEKDENGAGKILKWIIPLLLVLLVIAWLIIKE